MWELSQYGGERKVRQGVREGSCSTDVHSKKESESKRIWVWIEQVEHEL